MYYLNDFILDNVPGTIDDTTCRAIPNDTTEVDSRAQNSLN